MNLAFLPVGAVVGFTEGVYVGIAVGAIDGLTVGITVGSIVGDPVGLTVGNREGETDDIIVERVDITIYMTRLPEILTHLKSGKQRGTA